MKRMGHDECASKIQAACAEIEQAVSLVPESFDLTSLQVHPDDFWEAIGLLRGLGESIRNEADTK